MIVTACTQSHCHSVQGNDSRYCREVEGGRMEEPGGGSVAHTKGPAGPAVQNYTTGKQHNNQVHSVYRHIQFFFLNKSLQVKHVMFVSSAAVCLGFC